MIISNKEQSLDVIADRLLGLPLTFFSKTNSLARSRFTLMPKPMPNQGPLLEENEEQLQNSSRFGL
jgi:hypothetical protein